MVLCFPSRNINTINNALFKKLCLAAIVRPMVQKDEKLIKEKLKNENAIAFLNNMTTMLTKNGGQYIVGKEVGLIVNINF